MREQAEDRYFERVEEHFGRRRGGPMVLSPKDWQLIRKWQEEGIPLPVVLRGINQAFDRFAASSPRPDRINSLGYCAQEVEGAWEEHRVAGTRSAVADDNQPGLPGAGRHLRATAARCLHAADAEGTAPLRDRLRDAAQRLDGLAAEADGGGLDARTLDRRAVALQEELEAELASAAAGLGGLAGLGIPGFSPYDV